jgi:UrcA family protein
MPRALLLALAFTILAAAHGPALAQTADGRQATVSLKGLDLNSREGATMFLHRLQAATAKVCGPAPDIRDLERQDAFNTCLARTKSDAIARLNNAEVSAVASGAAQEAATDSAKPKI